jgi:predicted dinucleotide-binding enzyme
MKIGFIGAGAIGEAPASQFVRGGHGVLLAWAPRTGGRLPTLNLWIRT